MRPKANEPLVFLRLRKENHMEYINTFETNLKEQGKAEKTIQSYTGDVIGFLKYLQEKELSFDGTLNRFTINSYKTHLLKENYEPTTINKKLNSLQSFNIHLISSGTMTEKVIDLGRDRIKIAKGSEKPVEVLSTDVIDSLLFHLETKSKSIRDKVIVGLLLYTGVRVSELCGIRIKDIDFLSHQLKVLGKGGKYREIPLKIEVVESIKKYLLERRQNQYYQSEHLILGQRGAVGRDAINRILVRITKEANLSQKLKPHTFRHTFCTNLIGKGVPITTVSKLAGHGSIETTARFYIGCSRQEKMDAVNLL
jgi:integrase/recombinase XerD